MPSNTYGRQVVEALVNKSGSSVGAGDVVIIDTTNDGAFTTTTTAGYTGLVGVAQEAIASNATGRVLTAGYAALVNVNASVTRGQFGKTHTVVKQATGVSARAAGTFCQWLTGGTTPTAHVFGYPDGSAASSGITFSTLGKTSVGASFKTARGVYLHKITLATDGSISAVRAYVKGDGSSLVGCEGVVYADAAGAPTNLLHNGGSENDGNWSIMNTTARWMTFAVGGLWVAADYWIGVFLASGADSRIQLAYDTGGTTGKYQNPTRPADSSVTTINDLTSGHECSIYADIIR
jgi:hypothetical protein